MNLIQSINVISFVLFYSLSLVYAGAYDRQAEWVEIGGKNYDFNAVGLTQSEASARCIRFGGKLFEPRDAKTNRDVFLQAGAKFNGNTRLWIGVSDVGTENEFVYLSDGTLVNFACESSAGGRAGCWRPVGAGNRAAQPIPEVPADPPSVGLDCVFGRADQDGKWATSHCVLNNVAAPAAGGITFATLPAKFGSICEKEVATTPPPSTPASTPAPPNTSDSTCLKSGITVIIGMLFFCYQ